MLILGVDVSKATLALALWQEGAVQALDPVSNTPDGWDGLVSVLALQMPTSTLAELAVVLEPTGGYELPFALWAYQRGWRVHRPNPRQVREWARSQGRRAKTDRQDALVLARYGAAWQMPCWQPLSSEVSELEALLRRREEVAGLLQQERNRHLHVQGRPGMHQAVPKSMERVIGVLEEDLHEIEQAIADQQAQHHQMQQTCLRLRSVPGVGAKNVLPLFVLLARWQTLTDGQGTSRGLVAYAGLDPQPYESGTSVTRRASISRQGDRSLRRALYMGAMGALHGDNPVRAFYQRLVGRGKAKKLALVAAMRKILVWAWAVFHSGLPFDAAKTGA
ncbi:MAG TPA: IS110 family transposase [Ktedonobacterales bacterium]|jgi:transposase